MYGSIQGAVVAPVVESRKPTARSLGVALQGRTARGAFLFLVAVGAFFCVCGVYAGSRHGASRVLGQPAVAVDVAFKVGLGAGVRPGFRAADQIRKRVDGRKVARDSSGALASLTTPVRVAEPRAAQVPAAAERAHTDTPELAPAPAAVGAAAAAAAPFFDLGVPVIGILAEPTVREELKKLGHSYLPASYVEWIEAAGGKVVPIPFDTPMTRLHELYGQLNGLLFPGGSVHINTNSSDSDYDRFSRTLFKWAVHDSLPVWGTCLGFEQLLLYASSTPLGAGRDAFITRFDSHGLFVPLNLTAAASTSRLLGNISATVLNTLTSTDVTINLHHYGVAPSHWATDAKLASFFRVLATNRDRGGQQFVSLVEGKELPFYGAQFHAEKNSFEFDQSWESAVSPDTHSAAAVEASSYLARFFVEQARRLTPTRHFASLEAFQNASIYNYAPVYTAKLLPAFDLTEQNYFFPRQISEWAQAHHHRRRRRRRL